jgi:hypothetical protein
MCHFYDHSFAILIQKMQSLLTILGIEIVTCSEIFLQIHLEVNVLCSTLAKEGICDISLFSVVSHKLLFHGS